MRFRDPSQHFQGLVVASYERFLLFASPTFNTALARDGIFQPLEIRLPDQFDWAARRCIARKKTELVFCDALIETAARNADIIRFISAAKHVDENLHASSPFDRLRVRRLLAVLAIAPAPAAFGLHPADLHGHQHGNRKPQHHPHRAQQVVADGRRRQDDAEHRKTAEAHERPALPGIRRGAVAKPFLLEPVSGHQAAIFQAACAVPPTVSPSSRKVGWPTFTGTLWPFLPQVPMLVSSFMSLPIIETRVNDSGPEPIRVAPLMAGPILPFSNLKASVQLKTNLTLVMS